MTVDACLGINYIRELAVIYRFADDGGYGDIYALNH